jgi:adenosylhomocysteine nucleosidase
VIGIVCAMQEEVDGVIAAAAAHSIDARGFTHLRLGETEAVVTGGGLGKVNAARSAATLIERFGCRALVSAGTAGGLDGAEPLEVIVGVELVQHDYGRSRGAGNLELYRPGDPPLPQFRRDDVAIALPDATRLALRALAGDFDHVRFGRFASGDTFVNDAATRARLVALGALAVDMECAAVAQVAEFHRLPWLVAKGISDSASNRSHEDFLAGLVEASRRSAEVVAALLPAIPRHRGS